MNKVYGLTAQTVLTYSEAVRHGYSWPIAMEHLKKLYHDNKAYAERLEREAKAKATE